MATIIQRRGGTAAQHATFIGAARELTVDTTTNDVRVHDGATPGGFGLLARAAKLVSDLRAELLAVNANKLVNGDFRVNQRGGTRTPAVGVYGFDRWKGHAGGLQQIVEEADMPAGTYTLSWSGGGQGFIADGAPAVSPVTATIAGGSNVSVVVPNDATNVKLETGSRATAFVPRAIGDELMRCKRYYQLFNIRVLEYAASAGEQRIRTQTLPIPMRAPPELTLNAATETLNMRVEGFSDIGISSFAYGFTSNVAAAYFGVVRPNCIANAEF